MKNRSCREVVATLIISMVVALIAASCSNIFGSYSNKVDPDASNYQGYSIAARSISLSPTTLSIAVGDTSTISVSQSPSSANNTIIWSSSSTSIATVSSSGVVTGVAAGSATVTAKAASGVTATCKVTVTSATGITLSPTTLSMEVGATSTIIATLMPSSSSDPILWSSSATSIATVSSSGVVTGVAAGTATITAKINSKLSATCEVTVDEYTTLIKGTWYSNTINSSSQCFKVAVTNGTTYTLSWWDKKASSNYTAYIQICVYADASETTALWNGYWYASGSSTGVRTKTFTATSSTAYIVVMPYTSYGTYQMKVD